MSLWLCSCATQNPDHPQLPATVAMNKDAGRGGLLIVMVRLDDGEKLPFALDTGSAMTIFDKSLESKLGERVDTGTLMNFGVKQDVNVYGAPNLYLGNVRLQMYGTNVITFDHKKLADQGWPAIAGIIGMDVLQYYCIQLDFDAGTMRFIDDKHADTNNWGTSFPMTALGDGCFSIDENLAGAKGSPSLVDTGCNSSGWLRPELYRQWTNQAATNIRVHLPDGTLGGESYCDLDLRVLDTKVAASDDGHVKYNGVGLRALAQNLVTLDFPHNTLYLEHINDYSLQPKDLEERMVSAEKSSIKTLEHLLETNQLPGASKNSHGKTTAFHFDHDADPYLDTGTLDVVKNGDSSVYHYMFTRTSKHGPWKLKRAWRTDKNGHTIEEYPVR
jgi:hypothetical protein